MRVIQCLKYEYEKRGAGSGELGARSEERGARSEERGSKTAENGGDISTRETTCAKC